MIPSPKGRVMLTDLHDTKHQMLVSVAEEIGTWKCRGS